MNPGGVYRLALHELHAAAGARFAERCGWNLPMDYGDAEAEYRQLRKSAVVVDRSYRSRFIVSGTDAAELLDTTFAGHVGELEEGRAMRAVTLSGGEIRDLAVVARTGGISYVVIGEPTRRTDTLERLGAARRPGFDVRVDDRTESTCLLSITGPASAAVVSRHVSESLAGGILGMQAAAFEFHGFRALAMRTSETGDDGFDLMLAPAVAEHLLGTLAGACSPAGYEAFDVARVEACHPAFDPDLEPGLSPAEADLDIELGIDGGRDGRILAAVILEGDRPAPAGSALFENERRVGELRSCVFSPGLRATIGLALIDSARALPGVDLQVEGRALSVAAKPLLRRRGTA